VIKAKFREQGNAFGDTDKHLVYGLKFVSKLVIPLVANTYVVQKGGTLRVDSSGTYIANVRHQSEAENFEFEWICPAGIRCSNRQRYVSITYDTFKNSGLAFWTAHSIKMRAYTDFVLGNGLREETAEVLITWLDININIALTGTQNPPNGIANSWQLTISDLTEQQIFIEWTITPALPSTALINSNTRKQYVIAANALTETWTY